MDVLCIDAIVNDIARFCAPSSHPGNRWQCRSIDHRPQPDSNVWLKGPTALMPVRAIGDRHRPSIRHCRSTLQRLIWNIKGEDFLTGFGEFPSFAVHRTNLQPLLRSDPSSTANQRP
jgi:hypothetical protein